MPDPSTKPSMSIGSVRSLEVVLKMSGRRLEAGQSPFIALLDDPDISRVVVCVYPSVKAYEKRKEPIFTQTVFDEPAASVHDWLVRNHAQHLGAKADVRMVDFD